MLPNRCLRATTLALVLALIALAQPTQILAQQFKLEFKLGLSSTTFRGESLAEFNYKTGFAGGVGLGYDFGNGFAVQPEILYLVKGAESECLFTGDACIDLDNAQGADGLAIHAKFDLTYLDIPVLLVYRFDTNGRLHPKLFAGPSVAMKLDATVTFRPLEGGVEQESEDTSVENFDVGLVFGGGFEYDVGDNRVSLGARSVLGFANTRQVEPALHNTGFVVFVGMIF